MDTRTTIHRLEGLEPDNLLAFLALLGLLKALDAVDLDREDGLHFHARAAWGIDDLPLRPRLFLARPATQEEIADAAARGIEKLATAHEFGGARNLTYEVHQCRNILAQDARNASLHSRYRVDLLAALMTDGAVKTDDKAMSIQPTPLCLLFGQGHQHFLERLSHVPRDTNDIVRGKGRTRQTVSASQVVAEALFQPWTRNDSTFSFRWDPEEDVRYALMAGDPTDVAYKPRTQHGANRLAAIGVATLTVVPIRKTSRAPVAVIGGDFKDGFSFAWPVWSEPASLAAIRVLLAHPALRSYGGLRHLSVEHVYVARRIFVGKFMNFTRAQPLLSEAEAAVP